MRRCCQAAAAIPRDSCFQAVFHDAVGVEQHAPDIPAAGRRLVVDMAIPLANVICHLSDAGKALLAGKQSQFIDGKVLQPVLFPEIRPVGGYPDVCVQQRRLQPIDAGGSVDASSAFQGKPLPHAEVMIRYRRHAWNAENGGGKFTPVAMPRRRTSMFCAGTGWLK